MRKEKSTYKKGIVIALVSMLLLTTVLVIKLAWQTGSPRQIFVGPVPPADFATIREAIDNATDGDIIEVMDEGSPYNESVVVNKSIVIERWIPTGPECVVNGYRTSPVFNVVASNVRIHNFKIQNGTYGIYLSSMSANNIITDNNITLNAEFGVFIDGSRNNTFSRNQLTMNHQNFGINVDVGATPSLLDDFVQHIDESNSVDGKPIYYLLNEHDKPVPSDAGYIALINSTNITVEGAVLRNNRQGILVAYTNDSWIGDVDARYNYDGVQIWESHNNTILGSVFSHNEYNINIYNSTINILSDNVISGNLFGNDIGIELSHSTYNNFTGNIITSCMTGIEMMSSNNNTFYQNNIINNTYQTVPSVNLNIWDNGREGNYWSDYPGSDTNRDGIGDTNLPCHSDYHPLVKRWSTVRDLDITRGFQTPYYISIHSDHVIASLKFHLSYNETVKDGYVYFNVTAGYSGYFNITIPRDRLDDPFELYINGTKIDRADYQVNYTRSHFWLHYTFEEGARYMVKIVSYRLGTTFGDITGPLGVPDGRVDMRDVGAVCNQFGTNVYSDPIDISEDG